MRHTTNPGHGTRTIQYIGSHYETAENILRTLEMWLQEMELPIEFTNVEEIPDDGERIPGIRFDMTIRGREV